MSMEKVIAKEDLYSKLEQLLREFEIIGPRELPNKSIFYQSSKNVRDLYLSERFTTEPIKKFFFSPSELIFKEGSEDKDKILEDIPLPANKRIIIGVRPCEAKGLILLDKVFDSDYKDNFYINDRKRTIIVGLACSKPDRSCFCTSMGCSPTQGIGMDVLLFANGDGFVIEIITDKGEDVFGSLGKALDEKQKESLEVSKQETENAVKRKINVPQELDKIFESDYWGKISQSCISCGVCTYLCPTCHCFDLIDENRKRLRCYDGCSFPDFTLEASGETPRPTKKERYRQRIFHKFNYFQKNFGENLCVGCGRCIRYCPVKIDIADIVDKMPVTGNNK